MAIQNIDAHAAELHKRAIVIDAHSDILMAVADGRMRLGEWTKLPDPATWEPPPGLSMSVSEDDWAFSPHTLYFGSAGQYSIPQFRAGGLTAQVCAIYLEHGHLDRALQRALEMTWWLHREAAENDDFELITSVADIHRIKREGKCGGVLAFEGFEPLGSDLRLLDIFYALGLRLASLTHCRRNVFADGEQGGVNTGGLAPLGRQAVRRMNELGIVVDLVHINEAGFWEMLDLTQDPVVLSHSSSTMFPAVGEGATGPAGGLARPGLVLPRDRARLEAIARNGGVLCVISFYRADLEDMIADIEVALEVMGPDHVGLGSDYWGWELAPKGLEDISKIPAITRRLVERGHDDEVILKIMGGNLLRVFDQVWKT